MGRESGERNSTESFDVTVNFSMEMLISVWDGKVSRVGVAWLMPFSMLLVQIPVHPSMSLLVFTPFMCSLGCESPLELHHVVRVNDCGHNPNGKRLCIIIGPGLA